MSNLGQDIHLTIQQLNPGLLGRTAPCCPFFTLTGRLAPQCRGLTLSWRPYTCDAWACLGPKAPCNAFCTSRVRHSMIRRLPCRGLDVQSEPRTPISATREALACFMPCNPDAGWRDEARLRPTSCLLPLDSLMRSGCPFPATCIVH